MRIVAVHALLLNLAGPNHTFVANYLAVYLNSSLAYIAVSGKVQVLGQSLLKVPKRLLSLLR